MSELANALRQRLASADEPREHPDADTLTSYLEQLLPASERHRVMEHLAACRHCRDVIALSLPEPVLAQGGAVPAASPAWRGLRAWRPALRLAASLASLAIVAAVIIELPRQQRSSPPALSSAASNPPLAAPAPAESMASQPAVAATVNPTPREADTRTVPSSAQTQSVRTIVAAEAARVGTAAKTGEPGVSPPYVNVQMFANDASATVPAVDLPSAPAPRALIDRAPNIDTLGSNSQLTAADAPHQAPSSKPLRILAPATSTTHFGLSLVTTVGRDAKQLFHRPTPLISANLFAGSTMGAPGQFNPAKELKGSPEPLSAAPPAGKDLDALDQSRAFTAHAMSDASAKKMEGSAGDDRLRRAAAAPTAWKVADGKLLKLGDGGAWVDASPAGEGIEFSIVSSRGSDIWAGGGSAALLHSSDGGATWERITLGASASGTITSIEVNGVKILVKSSSGQSWSSPDGGRTWALQD